MASDPDIPKGKHAPIRNTRAADRPPETLPERAKKAVEPSKGRHSKKKKKKGDPPK
jgi:hypothetical protein